MSVLGFLGLYSLALKKNGMESKLLAFHHFIFFSLTFLFLKIYLYYIPFSVSISFIGHRLKGISLDPRLEMHMLLETTQVMKMNEVG